MSLILDGTAGVTTPAIPSAGPIVATSINFGGATLSTYTQGSFTLSGVSGWTTVPTCTCYYTIIGNMVTVLIGQLYGTSSSTAALGQSLPSLIRPNTVSGIARISPGCRMYDPGNSATEVWGLTSISASGDLNFYWNANGNNWTASGSKYIDNGVITYLGVV